MFPVRARRVLLFGVRVERRVAQVGLFAVFALVIAAFVVILAAAAASCLFKALFLQ